MTLDLSQIHFMRPAFLLFVPIVLLFWAVAKRSLGKSGWEHYLPKETIRVLQVRSIKKSTGWKWYFLIAPLILCVAGAGPTWLKQPVPTLQNQRALVVLLDLSPSMLAQDLKPDRLTRAKFKLIDILRKYEDGQVALIAYAGDAHTVSPLTDDPNTLQVLLPALQPAIMPSQGSNTEAAIVLARQLLRDANISSGDILLITDGVTPSAAQTIRTELGSDITLSILGVGGAEAAPIPSDNGRLLRGRDGEIVLSRVNESELKQLASQLGGRYARLNNNEQDINYLISDDFEAALPAEQVLSDNSFDGWVDMGHWFLLLVLPLMVWCFRKGFIYCLPLLFLTPIERSRADESIVSDTVVNERIDDETNQTVASTNSSVSQNLKNSSDGFSWNHLWQTPDQRAAELIGKEQYADAAKTFEREDWRAVANYKNGDFAEAVKQLAGSSDSTSLYNKGNALAMSGDLKQALKAFEQVLAIEPEHVDAQHNKKVIEQLMQQEQQQEQEGDPQDNSEEDQESSEQQSNQEQSSDEQESGSSDEESESSEQDSSSDSSEQQSDPEKGEEQEEAESEPTSSESEEESSEAQEPEEENSEAQESENESEQKAADAEQQSEERNAEQESNEQENVEEVGELLKDTSEQWLRGIKDDPSGLLRRKFQYQAEQNKRSARQPNRAEERY